MRNFICPATEEPCEEEARTKYSCVKQADAERVEAERLEAAVVPYIFHDKGVGVDGEGQLYRRDQLTGWWRRLER